MEYTPWKCRVILSISAFHAACAASPAREMPGRLNQKKKRKVAESVGEGSNPGDSESQTPHAIGALRVQYHTSASDPKMDLLVKNAGSSSCCRSIGGQVLLWL